MKKFKTGDIVVTTNSKIVPVGTEGIVVSWSTIYPDTLFGKPRYSVDHLNTIYGRKGDYSDDDLRLKIN